MDEGSAEKLEVDARVDIGEYGLGVVSGDIFATTAAAREWLASFRSKPGIRLSTSSTAIEIVCEDRRGQRTFGLLRLTPSDSSNNIIGQIVFD